MNPYAILVGVILVMAAICGAGWQGFRLGRDHEIAQQAKTDVVVKAASDAMFTAAAKAISGIEVKNVIVKQRLETEVREVPVYRDCLNTDVGMRLINTALTGTQSESTSDRKLPATSAADGPELRSNGPEAGRGGNPLP